MKIRIALDAVYVPAWNGNRELPEEEQVQVYYRFLTGPERDGIYMTDPLEYDTDGKVSGMKIRIDDFYKKMIKTCVKRIENLEAESGDGTVKIESGEQLFAYPELADLYVELRDFLVSENSPVDKKKLKSDTVSWPETGESSSQTVGARLEIVSKTSEQSNAQYMSDQAT